MAEPTMAEFPCPYSVDPHRRQVHDVVQYWVGAEGVVAVVCPWYEKGACKSVGKDKPDKCFVKGGSE